MADSKTTIKQFDFSLGEVRPEFIEADNSEVRERSVMKAVNVLPSVSGSLKRRPGTRTWIENLSLTNPLEMEEMTTSDGKLFLVVLYDNVIRVYRDDGSTGTLVFTDATDWEKSLLDLSESSMWIAAGGDTMYIGSGYTPIHALFYDGSVFQFGEAQFSLGAGNVLEQPYYAFLPGITLNPSGAAGAITVTSSSPVFGPAHVGKRLRYHGSELLVTGYVDSWTLNCNVVTELPVGYDVGVVDASGFEVGEIVVTAEGGTGFSGLVVGKAVGNILKIATISGFSGPYAGTGPDRLVGRNTSSACLSKTALASPLPSPIWEEPLMSDVGPGRGYPNTGALVGGRLWLGGVRGLKDMIIGSSVRGYMDFGTGLDDGDAIIRSVGTASSEIRHIINGGDLVILTDIGAYYVDAKGGTPITPSNFNPVLIDSRGAGDARPQLVDDSVVYSSASNNAILTARLDGNIYLKWSVIEASQFHSHLIQDVQSICPPPKKSSDDGRFALILGREFVAAAYRDTFDFPGFFPWQTSKQVPKTKYVGAQVLHPKSLSLDPGQPWREVVKATPFGDRIMLLVSNDASGGGAGPYDLEVIHGELGEISYLDRARRYLTPDRPGSETFPDWGRHVVADGVYQGSMTAVELEAFFDAADDETLVWVGAPFDLSIVPWPKEVVGSRRLGLLKARTSNIAISVRNTDSYSVDGLGGSAKTQSVNTVLDYTEFDLTDVDEFSTLGNPSHHTVEIRQDNGGAFELSAYTAEVQA